MVILEQRNIYPTKYSNIRTKHLYKGKKKYLGALSIELLSKKSSKNVTAYKQDTT